MTFLHTVGQEVENRWGQAGGDSDHSDVYLDWRTPGGLGQQHLVQPRPREYLLQPVCHALAFRSGILEKWLLKVLQVCKLVEEKLIHAFAVNPVRVH